MTVYIQHSKKVLVALIAAWTVGGWSHLVLAADGGQLNGKQTAACRRLGLDTSEIAKLIDKPLYKCNEAEVDKYLQFLSATEPSLRKRVVQLARKNIGQPYELYLLGELPFETYDPQPIYCLKKSDCLVFTEHTYAMALSRDWPTFMRLLQRIRYHDGQIGVATRNHFTAAGWNVSNRWLVEDITAKLAGDTAVAFHQVIDRSKFLKKRYGLNVSIPIQQHDDEYLPYEEIGRAKPELRDGDFVNIVRGTVKKGVPLNETFGSTTFVGHVGLIGHGPDGEVHLIHSSEPKVREEPIDAYIARSTRNLAAKDAAGKARLVGFKFLRLRDNPLKNLREIDGPDAPRVTLPGGGAANFGTANRKSTASR
ncbi:MAG TPA: N-acetylmuramoyl-L-alanine amidase-like domain-containing protein [Lacipirellulaceae bacterium]|nr:N-acetylmuramoyl-L-alanine amidase-like domain-containing protein [Lacipirellulaceae bacterium]